MNHPNNSLTQDIARQVRDEIDRMILDQLNSFVDYKRKESSSMAEPKSKIKMISTTNIQDPYTVGGEFSKSVPTTKEVIVVLTHDDRIFRYRNNIWDEIMIPSWVMENNVS